MILDARIRARRSRTTDSETCSPARSSPPALKLADDFGLTSSAYSSSPPPRGEAWFDLRVVGVGFATGLHPLDRISRANRIEDVLPDLVTHVDMVTAALAADGLPDAVNGRLRDADYDAYTPTSTHSPTPPKDPQHLPTAHQHGLTTANDLPRHHRSHARHLAIWARLDSVVGSRVDDRCYADQSVGRTGRSA